MANEVKSFAKLVRDYEEKARSFYIGNLVGSYIYLIKKPEAESTFIEKTQEQAYRNVLNTLAPSTVISYYGGLVEKLEKKYDQKVELKINFLERSLLGGTLLSRPDPSMILEADIYSLGEDLYDLLKEYLIAEKLKIDPCTLEVSEGFNFNSELEYQQSKEWRGLSGSGLIKAIVSQILRNYNDQFFGSIEQEKLDRQFELYVLQQTGLRV